MSFFGELKRRNVFRVGLAYAIASWVILQIVDVVAEILELPVWAPKLILVILAVGFIPALIFAWAYELTPEGLKKEKDVDRTQSITASTGRKLDFMIIGVLVIAIGFLLVDRFVASPVQEVVSGGAKSIAVLPFVNMSSDTEQDYFSDGITEEILNSLASVKELKVAGRTSSFAFKGQNDDLRKIGDTLGVDHILEGSVRKAGTTVRITAQLIQVDDGFHLWSETYDRELDDIFVIQDEIAAEILAQLKAQLLKDELLAIESKRTNSQAYDYYLRAKQDIYERNRLDLESAVALLDKAIELDPAYAPAMAQRGIATLLLSDQSYGTIPHEQALEESKTFIERSLELNPELAEGWAGLGLYHANVGHQNNEAIEALSKALEINPNMIDARNWLYVAVTQMGDLKTGLEIVESIVEIDPLYRPAFGNSINSYGQYGYFDKGYALIERFSEFYPNDPRIYRNKAMLHLWQGEAAEALPLAKQALDQQPTDIVFRVTYSFALAQTSQVETLAEEGAIFFKPYALATLDRWDEAYDIAHEMAEQGFPESLFGLLNWQSRSKEVVDYIDERWTSVEDFANSNDADSFGYGVMEEAAVAYKATSDYAKFDEAMRHIEDTLAYINSQGIDNGATQMANARYLVLAEDHDAAVGEFERAIKSGIQYYGPISANPIFAPVADDPRFMALEQAMFDNVNEDRIALGLDPLDVPIGAE